MSRDMYLALGDSITAGHGASHPGGGFVPQVYRFIRQQKLADRLLLVARNGWTTQNVLDAAITFPPTLWESVNVLTLLTGGNDLRKLLRRHYFSFSGMPISPQNVLDRIREYRFYMDRLCNLISVHQVPHVVVVTTYNPVPHFPLGVSGVSKLNEATHAIAKGYGFDIVDVYDSFLRHEAHYIDGYRAGRIEDLISPIRRPIHPNNLGHRCIADLITRHLAQTAAETATKSRSR